MLTRLTPRASSSETKKSSRPSTLTSSGKPLTPASKSLRGREISVSSEDEDEKEGFGFVVSKEKLTPEA